MTLWRAVARPLPPSLQKSARNQLVRMRHRGLGPADALLASYPKSGSTWLRFMLAHALTDREADFDTIRDTVPPVGRQRHAPRLLPGAGRLVRSHEPLAPFWGHPGQKIISLVRDGRDVALSYLAHEQRYRRATGDVAEFAERFMSGRVDSYGPWHEHVLAAVELERSRTVPVLRVTYEGLRTDTSAELEGILRFLGLSDIEVQTIDLDHVVQANKKDSMRQKETRSEFLGTMESDGSPLVRPDRQQGWDELVPLATRQRFEATCGPAMRAVGYST